MLDTCRQNLASIFEQINEDLDMALDIITDCLVH